MHNGHDNDGVLGMEHKLTLKQAYPKIYSPGSQSGVETNMAVADDEVFVPVADVWSKFTKASIKSGLGFKIEPPLQGTGQFEALSLKTGEVLWNKKMRFSPYGDATVTNDLVFTTTFAGQLIAFNRTTGAIVWQAKLPAGSNASVSIDGDMLVAVAGFPLGKNQKPEIVAYKLGAASSSGSGSGEYRDHQHHLADQHRRDRRRRRVAQGRYGSLRPELRDLPHARGGGFDRDRRAQPRSAQAEHGDRGSSSHRRRRRHAGVRQHLVGRSKIQAVAKFVSTVAGKPLKGKVKKSSGGGF